MSGALTLWESSSQAVVADSVTSLPTIIGAAGQLRERERSQIADNFEAGHYELAASYIWHRTMALLKKQLSKLGSQFVSELLQRPDIDEYTDLQSAMSDFEALSLAKDLGVITATQAMRLSHSQKVINHFAQADSEDDLEDHESLTREEAVTCLRVCVQGVLGQQKVEVAEDFAAFRTKLEQQTFTLASPEVVRLQQSPYFYKRTAMSILIASLRTQKGAALEHSSRNAVLIIPLFWNELKKPEKWQLGQAYAAEFSDGKKDAVRALHNVLLAVKGFDFVPENLRSNTFTQVANRIIQAHQGADNFYNEPGPMRELAALGTSIPSPAFAICMTAVLCVKLGNYYGDSWAAQPSADEVLKNVSSERWMYYINERLEFDRIILPKLTDDKPTRRWMSLINGLDIAVGTIDSKQVRDLVKASKASDREKVQAIARRLWQAALGS